MRALGETSQPFAGSFHTSPQCHCVPQSQAANCQSAQVCRSLIILRVGAAFVSSLELSSSSFSFAWMMMDPDTLYDNYKLAIRTFSNNRISTMATFLSATAPSSA